MIFALQLAVLSFTHSFNDFLEEESHLLSFIYEDLKYIRAKVKKKNTNQKFNIRPKFTKPKNEGVKLSWRSEVRWKAKHKWKQKKSHSAL